MKGPIRGEKNFRLRRIGKNGGKKEKIFQKMEDFGIY